MGISTIQSYQGSKIFEAIGIDKDVIDKYFTNTVSRIGGITLEDIAEQCKRTAFRSIRSARTGDRPHIRQCGTS